LKVLVVVGTVMSKGFGSTGVLSHKRGEIHKDNGTGLGVVDEGSTLWRVVVNLQAPCVLYIRTGVSLLSRERFLYI